MKQLKGKPMENFYGCPRELSLNGELCSREQSIIRDAVIANMQNGENERELMKETRTPKKALELAIIVEMGIQNALKNSGLLLTQYLIPLLNP